MSCAPPPGGEPSTPRCCCCEVEETGSGCGSVAACGSGMVPQCHRPVSQQHGGKEGVLSLMKKGFFGGKTWKPHLFSLRGDTLEYRRSCKEGTPPDGVVQLNHCSVWDASKDMRKSHCFIVYHPNREPLYVCAASEESKVEWMREIKAVADAAPWREEDMYTSEGTSEDEDKRKKKLQKRRKRMNEQQALEKTAAREASIVAGGGGSGGGGGAAAGELEERETAHKDTFCSTMTPETAVQQVQELSRFVESLTYGHIPVRKPSELLEALRYPIKHMNQLLDSANVCSNCACNSTKCDRTSCADFSPSPPGASPGGSGRPQHPEF